MENSHSEVLLTIYTNHGPIGFPVQMVNTHDHTSHRLQAGPLILVSQRLCFTEVSNASGKVTGGEWGEKEWVLLFLQLCHTQITAFPLILK